MSSLRRIILIILISITIGLWAFFAILVLSHKEDEELLNYKPYTEEKIPTLPEKIEKDNHHTEDD